MGGIYGWRFKLTGEIKYIGKTVNFANRKYQHIKSMDKTRNYHGCRVLVNAFLKYGIDNFEFVILQDNITDPIHMLLAEGLYIRQYNTFVDGNGYNIKDPWRDKEREKTYCDTMKRAARKRSDNPEYRQKLKDAWSRRDKNSVEEIALRKRIIQKRSANPIWRKNQKLGIRRFHESSEAKEINKNRAQKRSNNLKWLEYVANMSSDPEWIKKNQEGRIKMKNNPEWRKHIKEASQRRIIPIICIETKVIYNGITDAMNKTGIDSSSINKVCRGKLNTAGGFHWAYTQPRECETDVVYLVEVPCETSIL